MKTLGNKPLISLAMIVKNEEAALAHCLESVKALVDEIIIVDTGSTDNTIDIARGFGAEVHHFQWRDDFSAARNESLKHCKGEWALILDGDEAVDPLDYEIIKNACIHPRAEAYELIHRHYMNTPNLVIQDSKTVPNKSKYGEGKNLPFYADTRTTRLVKMFDGLRYAGSIHETFDPLLLSLRKAIPELDAVIHHYGKLFDDREEYKTQYYLMLAMRDVEKNPDDIVAQFYLLQQALIAKQWETVISAAQAIRKAGVNAAFVLYGGGQALQELGRHKEAIEFFDELLSHDPKHSLALLYKASSCRALGNVSLSRQLIMRALELDPTFTPAYGRLAELEFALKNFDAARQAILNAIKIAPKEPSLYSDLITVELNRNNRRQAGCDAILALQNCPDEGGGLWHRLAAVYLLETGDYKRAKSVLESGHKIFPDNPDLARLCVQVRGALSEP